MKRKNIEVPSEHLKDEWRYRHCEDWQFDQLISFSPENDWIDRLDGVDDTEPERPFSARYMIESRLSSREATVVKLHLLEGLSFRKMANRLNGNYTNLHAVYHAALKKLAPDMLKFLTNNRRLTNGCD